MSLQEEDDGTLLRLETRDQWHADPPSSTKPLLGQAQYVFCALQTECEPCKDKDHCASLMRELQYEHAQFEKLPDIRYNFLIGGDGRVYEGRGWHAQPTLPARYSHLASRSYYIGLIGDLTEDPTQVMLDTRETLLAHLMTEGLLSSKFTHFALTRLDLQYVQTPYKNELINESIINNNMK